MAHSLARTWLLWLLYGKTNTYISWRTAAKISRLVGIRERREEESNVRIRHKPKKIIKLRRSSCLPRLREIKQRKPAKGPRSLFREPPIRFWEMRKAEKPRTIGEWHNFGTFLARIIWQKRYVSRDTIVRAQICSFCWKRARRKYRQKSVLRFFFRKRGNNYLHALQKIHVDIFVCRGREHGTQTLSDSRFYADINSDFEEGETRFQIDIRSPSRWKIIIKI